jgi:hypothetical protein
MTTEAAELVEDSSGAAAGGGTDEGASPPPPGPPRAGGGVASWTEPRVRFWWLIALGVFLAGAYVAGREVALWRHEVDLIRNGTPVQAEVRRANGYSSPGKQLPPDAVVDLRYFVNGKQYEKTGFLRGRTEHIAVRKTVPIRVNPTDPDDWSGAVTPAVLWQQLTGALVALPVFLGLAVVSVLRRRGALRAWRRGEARAALVVESRHTALAPRSRLVRCTPAGTEDNRVVDVFVPHLSGAELKAGDVLWVVYPPGRAGGARPYAAAWFDRSLVPSPRTPGEG